MAMQARTNAIVVVEVPPRISSRMRDLRMELQRRLGDQYGIPACAKTAGIAERAWAAYERGENEPTVTVALSIAKVLGVTVEQLDFRRLEGQ